MERKDVLVSEEDLSRQREFTGKIRDLLQEEGRRPLACVDTFGCQQNVADGQRILGMLQEMGFDFTQEPKEADVVILNTCAVREHAEKRVFGNLGALTHSKKANPRQIICVCGCMAQEPRVAEKIRESYRHVDLVFGPHVLWKFPELLYQVYTRHGRVFSVEDEHGRLAEGLPVVREKGVKAWVSIMYGCNNFCSYCIVPYVRGRERSRRPEAILAECRELIESGYKDITLLGQNVNSYGKDLDCGVDFSDLLAEIAGLPGDFLVRFMTSHPRDAGPKLFDTMARFPKIAKQLHLPVQCGSDRVLKAMNRHYNRQQYLELVDYARKVMPELVLTSDVIVGFPGETEAEFEETVTLIRQVRYDALFTFIYSPRPGTPAASLPDPATRQEKNQWFDRLCAAQNAISEEKHRAYVGKTLRVLVDGTDGDLLTARTEGGRLVRLTGDAGLIGRFCQVKIDGATTWSLTGTLAAE